MSFLDADDVRFILENNENIMYYSSDINSILMNELLLQMKLICYND